MPTSKPRRRQPHVLLIVTDQQTWMQNWDAEFSEKHLPAMKRLMEHGLTFNRGHCNSCTCSPSRTTLLTGTYPAHHRVTQVLAFDDPFNGDKHKLKGKLDFKRTDSSLPKGYTQVMQQELSSNYQNMGKMMASAGYQVAYKGKWHITKPTVLLNAISQGDIRPKHMDYLYWTPQDVPHLAEQYGFNGWNYPDAGDDAKLYNFGGGTVNNDGRFIDGNGQSGWYGDNPPVDRRRQDSAVSYIKNYDNKKPFFLVISLVNPHDVLSYPGDGDAIPKDLQPLYEAAGYQKRDFDHIKVSLPSTWNEKLRTKPKIQRTWNRLVQQAGPIHTRVKAKTYLQFYAYLQSLVDHEILKVLNALDTRGFTKDTLIVRTSDHGDMAMAHGKQRQKMYNVYEQTLNVPLIFSNPVLFPKPKSTEALAGLIDLMPTLANVAGVDPSQWTFQGKNLMPVVNGKQRRVQDYLHFTYDDDYVTTPLPWRMGASHIRCLIEEKKGKLWKYAVYFDPNYGQKMEYEMYELRSDPEEKKNLAHHKFSRGFEHERQRLHRRLIKVMNELGTMPDSVLWPKVSGAEGRSASTRLPKVERRKR